MRKVGIYSFTYHSPSASVRGRAVPSKRDSPACPHGSQVDLNSSSQSGDNQGSDGGSTPHRESFQPSSEAGASPTRPGEKPGRPSFKCTACPTRCTQEQVLKRHYREKHQPGFECSQRDCGHKWTRSRESEYRKHLKKKHKLEDDEIDEILGRPQRRRRRRGRVIESDLPRRLSPPPIERDRQSLAEPQQRPLILPLLATGKDANHTSPPLIPSVAYNPRLGHAEPKVTTTDHEDSSELEHLATTHALSRLLSEEDFALLVGHLKFHGRIRFPSVHPGGSTTANIPPDPGMLHIPALPSPVGGSHTSPVLGILWLSCLDPDPIYTRLRTL